MTEKILPPPLPGEENNADVAVPARNDLRQQEVDEQDED